MDAKMIITMIEGVEIARLNALSIMKGIEQADNCPDTECIYEDVEEAVEGMNIAIKTLGEALTKVICHNVSK